jgi:hypothetical protein
MATRSALDVHRHRTSHDVRLLRSAAGEFFRAAGTSLGQFAVGGRTCIVLGGTDATAGRRLRPPGDDHRVRTKGPSLLGMPVVQKRLVSCRKQAFTLRTIRLLT